MQKLTYYDVLAVPQDASLGQIRRAYRINAMKTHPDRNKAPNAHQRFIRLRHAYEVLSNPERRSRYNEKLRALGLGMAAEVDYSAFPGSRDLGRSASEVQYRPSSEADSASESIYYDPIEEAINIYTMSWRDFSSYPLSIKVRKVLLTFVFRILYALIGTVLGFLIMTVWFWFFHGIHHLPLLAAVYKYLVYLLAAFFLIFGKPIVFHYASKWFGLDTDM